MPVAEYEQLKNSIAILEKNLKARQEEIQEKQTLIYRLEALIRDLSITNQQEVIKQQNLKIAYLAQQCFDLQQQIIVLNKDLEKYRSKPSPLTSASASVKSNTSSNSTLNSSSSSNISNSNGSGSDSQNTPVRNKSKGRNQTFRELKNNLTIAEDHIVQLEADLVSQRAEIANLNKYLRDCIQGYVEELEESKRRQESAYKQRDIARAKAEDTMIQYLEHNEKHTQALVALETEIKMLRLENENYKKAQNGSEVKLVTAVSSSAASQNISNSNSNIQPQQSRDLKGIPDSRIAQLEVDLVRQHAEMLNLDKYLRNCIKEQDNELRESKRLLDLACKQRDIARAKVQDTQREAEVKFKQVASERDQALSELAAAQRRIAELEQKQPQSAVAKFGMFEDKRTPMSSYAKSTLPNAATRK